MADKCENCTEKCPRAEMAHQAALGRMYATKEFIALLKKVESGELVEVVRCKDCKHYHHFGEGVYGCRTYGMMKTKPDGFCSQGKRRNNETLAEDIYNWVGKGKPVREWISVKDGLPNLIPCDAGTAYSEAVNVLTSGRKVLTAIWDGFDWICDAEFWDAEDEEITHWAPVPLPLPPLPKGE